MTLNVAANPAESVSLPPPPANDSKLENDPPATVPADGLERANVSLPLVPVRVSVPLPPMTDSMPEATPPTDEAVPVPRFTLIGLTRPA